ncbi:MAG: response regulator [Micavibrio sp.]|nr:MAG: response regulator [Micavibrio sp.]
MSAKKKAPNKMPINLLIVDDSDLDIQIAKKAFAHCEKTEITVHSAADGETALNFLTEADNPRAHMILLDINMPKKSGIEVLAEIKNNKDLKDIPVVMLTNSSHPDDMQASYKNYANAFITKPQDFSDMVDFAHRIEEFWFLSAKLPQEE